MATSTKSPKKRPPPGAAPGRKKSVSKTRTAAAPPAPTALKIPPPEPISLHAPIAISSASLTVGAGAAPEVQTIIYVHGIGNKPLASILKCQWDTALFGAPLGDHSRMAYWVNREYYPTPSVETCASGDIIKVDDDEVSTKAIMALAEVRPTDEQNAVYAEIEALTDDPARQAWLRTMAEKMASAQVTDGAIRSANVSAKVLPLPGPLRRLIAQKITRAFLRDVNDFLFHLHRRKAMEQSFIDRLNAGGGPFIVIAHSQGSMIAYNVLRQLAKADCDVRLFVTIGSPLGMEEVHDVFKRWVPGGTLGVPPCVSRWVNVADWLDPVALDHDISNDFTPNEVIENFDGLGLNPDSPWNPHSGTGYLKTKPVQNAVHETAGNAFPQLVGRAIIAKDLIEDLEDSDREERHNTLVQLSVANAHGPQGQATLAERRENLMQTIRRMVGDNLEKAEIEPLKRFLAAKLTRLEVEQLRTQFKDLQIERVWRDAAKKALIYQSTNTVQARPANTGYAATGRDICWAVLDTGIRADHPHFKHYRNVQRQWDCTQPGKPIDLDPKSAEFAELDKFGHGTHVAGIIAGRYEVPIEKNKPLTVFSGMAPEAILYGFKVLDDQGNGQDSWIIKALDFIGDLNESAGNLVIQGINLSLGGSFDPSVYGCGHTPLCQELRRLWGQGVIVCLAAGNEGYELLQTGGGEVPANMDLSIGDPANLDEAIAVGSIHKTNPHTYGVSYFSSRGPTADGRRKPDLVAPGEQILSAYHKFDRNTPAEKWSASDLYVEMSGTSMAAPHVSGILAAFLSMRREFISYPDRVKRLLLENCTDLCRDPYIQGHGMPNLIKMLSNS